MAQQATTSAPSVGITVLSGRDIRLLRLVRDLSQEEVATRCGMSAATLSLLEAGRRPLRADHELALLRVLFP